MSGEEKEPRSLEKFADDKAQARFAENQEIARQLRAVRAELGVTETARARAEEELESLQRIYEDALLLVPEPKWLKPPKGKGDNRATLVSFLSDLHAGERVNPDEMTGYNAYNLDICELRLKRFFEKVIDLSRTYLSGVKYDGIVLALGGDLVSGDIHDELTQTNELSVLDTTLWVAPKLTAGIEALAEEFGQVHVVSAPGNHGRDSKRPRHKGRSAHNADTHIAKMVAYYFTAANGAANVTFDIPESFDVAFPIYDYVFSMEHGDNMRFNGVSEIGALGPVKRGTLRKSNQHKQEGHPFHYNLLGHFHQYVPAASQGFVMNGSVKGYDEYARAGHFLPEEPQQALMVVTPEYGITNQTPVFVAKRDSEGW